MNCSIAASHLHDGTSWWLMCAVNVQHIFQHACKFQRDSREEGELTIGTLNAKLDDLSCTSDKVNRALALLRPEIVPPFEAQCSGT